MPFSFEFRDIIHEAYRKSFQIIVAPGYHKDFGNPKGFGSGFILNVDGTDWFVTACHVVDSKNEMDFVGWGNDDLCGVPMGINDEQRHESLTAKLSGFYEYIRAPRPADAVNLVFPWPLDLTFCKADFKLNNAITLGFSYPVGNLFFPAGEPHLKFDAQEIVLPDKITADSYFVVGTILGIDKTCMNTTTNHQFHGSLSFDHLDGNEVYLKAPYPVREKAEWSGLSGSAVVSYDGHLLGMLSHVVEGDDWIRVIPANAILRLIRQQQRLNNSGIDLSQPYILVGPGITMDDIRNNPAIKQIIDILE